MTLRTVLGIVSIIADVAFLIALKVNIYTDKAHMADGTTQVWHCSPADRLDACGKHELMYLQIFLAAVSVITSVLLVFGVRNNIVRIVQLISTAGSIVVFIIIMIIADRTHPRY